MIYNIAIFASGEGSNAQNCIDYFNNSTNIKIVLIASNNKNANVLQRAKNAGISVALITKNNFYETQELTELIRSLNIQLIVLAGFLWKIPENFIKEFSEKIINIHPSLLPKYGGKGMFGTNVHKAVIEAHETESGITIHYVNEKYDEGKIITQFRCKIDANETPETLQKKIQQLEQTFLPIAIEKLLL